MKTITLTFLFLYVVFAIPLFLDPGHQMSRPLGILSNSIGIIMCYMWPYHIVATLEGHKSKSCWIMVASGSVSILYYFSFLFLDRTLDSLVPNIFVTLIVLSLIALLFYNFYIASKVLTETEAKKRFERKSSKIIVFLCLFYLIPGMFLLDKRIKALKH